jgi:hypothetical protein
MRKVKLIPAMILRKLLIPLTLFKKTFMDLSPKTLDFAHKKKKRRDDEYPFSSFSY